MLLLPLLWLLVTFVCLGSGAGLYSLFFQDDASDGPSLPQLTVVGAGLVALECMAVSLAFPVGPSLIPVFGLQACAGFWLSHKTMAWPSQLAVYRRRDMLAVLAFLAAVLAMKGAAPVGSFDAGAYYRQTVLWIQQYGTVPGLANLHGRFGFNSSWHILAALFSFDLGNNQILEDLNEWIALVFGMEIAIRVVRTEKGPAYPVLAVALAFIVPHFLTAITPDLPATLITIWLLMEVARAIFQNQASDRTLWWIAMTAGYLVTIKLSMITVSLLALGAWLAIRSMKVKLGVAAVMVVLFAVWMTRFYVLTGYLAYPVPQAAMVPVHPDWQLSADRIKLESEDVEGFAKVPHSVLPHEKMSNPDRAKLSIGEWLPYWRKGLKATDMILLAVLLPALLLVVMQVMRRKSLPALRYGLLAFLVAAVGLWFLKAPDPRFAYGVLIGAPFLAIHALTLDRTGGQRLILPSFIALAVLCLDVRSVKQYLLKPGPYEEVTVKKVRIGGGDVWVPIPTGDALWEVRCQNQPLPCAPGDTPGLKDLEMRGPSLTDGFRLRAH